MQWIHKGNMEVFAVIWNVKEALFQSFSTLAGIMLSGSFRVFFESITLVNCYAPYNGREDFWKFLEDSGLLVSSSLILGGDLNFTLSVQEVWRYA